MTRPDAPAVPPSRPAAWLQFCLVLGLLAGCGADTGVQTPPDPAQVAGGVDQALMSKLVAATEEVRSDPENVARWATLGRTYEEAGLPEGARQTFHMAAVLSPEDPKLRYRAAIAHGQVADLESALTAIEAVLGAAPDYGPAWRRKGNWLLDLGRPDEAIEAFEQAMSLLPDRPDARIGLARAALLKDDVKGALGHAAQAFGLAPEDRYVRLVYGTALRRSGRLEEALPHLEAGSGTLPSYVDPWSESSQRARNSDDELSQRAQESIAAKRWPEAIERLERLAARRPDDSRVMLQLGVSLVGASRFDDAIRHYDKCLTQFPGSYDLMTARAAALRSAGKPAQSLQSIDKIIDRWPDRAAAYVQRGATLEILRDVEGARGAYQRAAALEPGDLRGRLFEGRLLGKLARYGEAAEALERGLLESSATPPPVYFQMLLQAQRAAQVSQPKIDATLEAARAAHGDEAFQAKKKK